MATINSIITKARNRLRDNFNRTDAINMAGNLSAAATTITVDDGEKFRASDIIECESETLFVIEAPRVASYINEGATFSLSDTTLTVVDGTQFAANDIIRIDEEKLKVTAVNTNNLTVTRAQENTVATSHLDSAPVHIVDDIVVVRAYMGSTAAAHNNDTAISIVNRYPTIVFEDGVKEGIKLLYPHIYIDHVSNLTGLTNRRTVDDCDTANWTQAGDAAAETTDTSDKQEGTASLKLGATYSAGTATYSNTPTSFDASSYEYLNVWIYVEELKDSNEDWYLDRNALQLRIGSDSANYKYINIGRDQLREGKWTLISENLQDFSDQGTPVMTAVDYIAVVLNDLKDIAAGDIKMDEWFLTTYPVSTNKVKYRLPTGVFGVTEVRLMESDDLNNHTKLTNWKTGAEDNYLVFTTVPPSEAKPMWITAKKEQNVPSSNTTALSLDDRYEPLIELYACLYALGNALGERTDYTNYSGKLAQKDSTVLDIIRTKRDLSVDYERMLTRLEKGYGGIELNQDILGK